MRPKLFVIAALLVIVPVAFAARPTVTVTKITSTARANYYNITYTTSADTSTIDTAFVFSDNAYWFTIEGLGEALVQLKENPITLECYSAETTADSVRHKILWQVSSKASPSVTAGLSPSADWVTASKDSATMINVTPGSTAMVSKFRKPSVGGQSTKMRLLIVEAGGVKCSKQVVTLRLVIPKS